VNARDPTFAGAQAVERSTFGSSEETWKGSDATLGAGSGALPGASGSALVEDPAELSTGARLGRYTVLRRLGAGAMGVVYSAYDADLDRKVAVKILKPRTRAVGSDDEGKLRLIREAKALARLSHPNVVAIHDVGAFADRVFIAMEFVDGRTLTQWLKERPRSWREILAALCEAGEGLAAAHNAGLIHRDFKPDNVLIGHDDRVRVLDFGLARATLDPAEEAAPTPDLTLSAADRSASIHVGITSTGVLIGTPAYMAAEQHIGQPADARSDLFAFCVTLYQALYGERPFAGDDLPSLAGNVIRGRVKPAPAGAKVPSWLRRAVVRGLSPSPSERYASMSALLEHLNRQPGQIRRRWLALVAVPALLIGVTVGALRGEPEPPCQGARARLDGVWDGALRSAGERAFLDTGLPYAATAWSSVTAVLDARAERWVAAHTAACEATHIHHAQSPALLDLRMLCLDRHRAELKELTAVLARADALVVEHALEGVGKLGDLASCDEGEALLEATPPPTDPRARERVAELRSQLAQARALELAGSPDRARGLAEAALSASRELAYPPLTADALLDLADLQQQSGDPVSAARCLEEAALIAAQARYDQAVARAYTDLISVAGLRRARYEEAAWAGHAAQVAIRRAESTSPHRQLGTLLQARRDLNLAAVLQRTARPSEALPLAEAALAIFERELGEIHPLVHRSLTALALIHIDLHQLPSARARLDRALDIARRVAGPEHPSVAAILTNLARVAAAQGAREEALALARQAVDIRDRVLAPDHPDRALSLRELAGIEGDLERIDDAYLHYQQALAILERDPHANADHRGALLNNLAILDLERGRLSAAHDHFAAALAVLQAAFGEDHQHSATTAANLAEVMLAEGDPEAASAQLRGALDTLRRVDPRGPLLAYALGLAGRAELRLGQLERAHTLLEEAIAVHVAQPDPSAAELVAARLDLARATLARTGDRARARQLAQAAQRDLQSASAPPLEAELRAFLAELR
jgi:tetratricopeptide (TPR) repeat protein/tRNA A-37 threonylcarbamoyl transferase component Bud32